MFIKKEFTLQTIAGKKFIFLMRGDEVDMTRIMSFNKTSVWLWEQLQGITFTEEEAFRLLINHYEGNSEQIRQNLQWWLKTLSEEGIIEL